MSAPSAFERFADILTRGSFPTRGRWVQVGLESGVMTMRIESVTADGLLALVDPKTGLKVQVEPSWVVTWIGGPS